MIRRLSCVSVGFLDTQGAIGWLMSGAVREDDGAWVPFYFMGQPGDDKDPWGIFNRFWSHFYDPL